MNAQCDAFFNLHRSYLDLIISFHFVPVALSQLACKLCAAVDNEHLRFFLVHTDAPGVIQAKDEMIVEIQKHFLRFYFCLP
jgi:hypothetical protein